MKLTPNLINNITMTKKDFETVAKSLGLAATKLDLSADQIGKLAAYVSEGLKSTNPRFDSARFIDAVCNNAFNN